MAQSFQVDDPRTFDVEALINTHLEFARCETPLCHVFALSAEKLATEDIVLYSCRDNDLLLAIGALRKIDDYHFEIKSMHTARAARGQGVGRRMLQYLIDTAKNCGTTRVSLETGTSGGFYAARCLYEKSGFEVCAPFGNYSASPDNVCMTLLL